MESEQIFDPARHKVTRPKDLRTNPLLQSTAAQVHMFLTPLGQVMDGSRPASDMEGIQQSLADALRPLVSDLFLAYSGQEKQDPSKIDDVISSVIRWLADESARLVDISARETVTSPDMKSTRSGYSQYIKELNEKVTDRVKKSLKVRTEDPSKRLKTELQPTQKQFKDSEEGQSIVETVQDPAASVERQMSQSLVEVSVNPAIAELIASVLSGIPGSYTADQFASAVLFKTRAWPAPEGASDPVAYIRALEPDAKLQASLDYTNWYDVSEVYPTVAAFKDAVRDAFFKRS